MGVFVDDAAMQASHLLGGRARWFHLSADTPEELHEFAARLGLKRSWFQNHGRFYHYDIVTSRRVTAIAMGAEQVDTYEFVRRLRRAIG